MNQKTRRVAVIGGNRIPFARSNGAYTHASNQDMLTAALDGLIDRYGLEGQKLGEVAGKAVMFVPGAAVGAIGAIGKKAEEMATGEGQGPAGPTAPKPHQPAKPTDLNKMGGVSKTIAAGIGGFGMLAGAAGGFVAGAGIASTGSLVNGLLAHNVSLANIGGAAAFGGAIGAVGMGVLGAVGGWKLVQAGRWVGDKVSDAVGKKD